MVYTYTFEDIQCHFVYSPFHEMIGSLSVLYRPEHHKSRLKWASDMAKCLGPEQMALVRSFGEITNEWLYMYSMEDTDKRLGRSVMDILSDPDLSELEMLNESIDEIIEFLKDYYQNFFYKDLAFGEPLMIRFIKKEFERCQKVGLYNYINGLHPRIEVTETKVNFHKYKLFEIFKNDLETVIVYADSFMMPHLLIGIEKNELCLISPAYITEPNRQHMPEDTLQIFKGLGDKTRLNILKYLYKQPMTTQGLANQLRLTDACISKHLKVLYKGGIVFKERDGNYIQYHMNQIVIDSLVMYLYELFE